MKSICDEFRGQQEHLYFYRGDEETRVPNFGFLKDHGKELQNIDDPFLNPVLFRKVEFQKSFQEANIRAESVFLETRKKVIQLLQMKKDRFRRADYLNFVDQVGTVRLASMLEPRIQKIAQNACSRPNAIYMKASHEMLICPNLMNMPKLTLEKILAHEFGHSIQNLQTKITCFDKFPHREANEAFADWVASEVLAITLHQEPNKALAKKKALESQMLFLSIACFSRETTRSYSYPSIQNRIEKIFLAQGAFQEAFQCQNSNTPLCI